MNGYEIGLYEKAIPSELSWKERLLTAKECGYDFLEISIDESDARLARLDWTDAQFNELQDIVRNTGLPIRSMCLSGHRKYPLGDPRPEARVRSLEIAQKAVDMADRLGIRIIQLAGYDVYYSEGTEETRRLFEENLRKMVIMAAQKGVLLGFETMETPFMNTVTKAMKYVKAVDSPYLGVYPDCGNLTNAVSETGVPVPQDMENGRGRIIAMHLKETVPGKFREIPFLTGHVNFPEVIAKAWELGVRRFVTEMWYTGSPEWKNDIRFAHDSMCAILDRQASQG